MVRNWFKTQQDEWIRLPNEFSQYPTCLRKLMQLVSCNLEFPNSSSNQNSIDDFSAEKICYAVHEKFSNFLNLFPSKPFWNLKKIIYTWYIMILQWICIKNTEALIEFNCKNLWVLKPRFDPLQKTQFSFFFFFQFKPYTTFASMVTFNHDLEEE